MRKYWKTLKIWKRNGKFCLFWEFPTFYRFYGIFNGKFSNFLSSENRQILTKIQIFHQLLPKF